MITIFCCLLACITNDDTSMGVADDLLGTWLLVEQYGDPGDGSGGFEKVKSGKTIQFMRNGTFNVKGSLCTMDSEDGPKSTGTFTINEELTEFSFKNYLEPDNCDREDYLIFVELDKGSLLLYYQCIEACEQKYKKI